MSLVKRCISVHLKVESVIASVCHEIKECSVQCLAYLSSKVCWQNRPKKVIIFKKMGKMGKKIGSKNIGLLELDQVTNM